MTKRTQKKFYSKSTSYLRRKKTASSEVTYKTLDSALHEEPDANLVVISVNGKFAAREAHKALDQQNTSCSLVIT